VTGGSLTLKGILIETTYHFDDSIHPEESRFGATSGRRYSCTRNGSEGLLVPDVPVELPGPSHIQSGDTIHCLLMTDVEWNFGIQKLLAVRRCKHNPGVWERVGLFRIHYFVVKTWFKEIVDRTEITII
jgi:hypothetical protein